MDAVDPDFGDYEHAERKVVFRVAHKRLDPIDGPRALGAKRCALQAQRRQQSVVERHVGLLGSDGGPDGCVLISKDGTVAFAIKRTDSRLFVEKRCCPPTGARTSHAMIFENASTFERWCDLDPTSFDDPLLADQVRRHGHKFFATHR